MDIGTGLTLFGSRKLIESLLGPTADYIGEGIKKWTQKRVNNVSNIFEIAARKLGDKIEQKGTVPPKVLKEILEEGSYCDDFLTAEYFGGVLASSRSGISRDDRGASFIKLISRMSAYQIRAHYVLYHIFKKNFEGKHKGLLIPEHRWMLDTFVPQIVFKQGMDFDDKEDYNLLVPHILEGLKKEWLLEKAFYGSEEYLKNHFPKAMGSGMIFSLSSLGIELFLWAHAKSDLHVSDFFDISSEFETHNKIKIDFNNVLTHKI